MTCYGIPTDLNEVGDAFASDCQRHSLLPTPDDVTASMVAGSSPHSLTVMYLLELALVHPTRHCKGGNLLDARTISNPKNAAKSS